MLNKEGEERDENNLVKADGIPRILPQPFLRSELITKSIWEGRTIRHFTHSRRHVNYYNSGMPLGPRAQVRDITSSCALESLHLHSDQVSCPGQLPTAAALHYLLIKGSRVLQASRLSGSGSFYRWKYSRPGGWLIEGIQAILSKIRMWIIIIIPRLLSSWLHAHFTNAYNKPVLVQES